MTWGYVAVAAATVVGGAISADSSRKASNTQAASTGAGIAEQQRQADLTRADQAPYRAAGVDALGQLQSGISQQPSAEDVMNTPGYQFGLTQGQTGLDRKIAQMGGRVSGAALKASSQYNTDYATTGFNAAYQRSQDRLNRLAALAGVGQTATQSSAAAGANAGNQISNLLTSQGNASAAGQIAQGNIWANTGNQLASLYGRNQGSGGSGFYGSSGGYNGSFNSDPNSQYSQRVNSMGP